MKKVWLVTGTKLIERRQAKFDAFKQIKIWSDQTLRFLNLNDLARLGKEDTEVMIVFGKEASRVIRAKGIKAKFKVYVPGFWIGRLEDELVEIRQGGYDLLLPEDTQWLSEFRKIHKYVYHVDRGFNPKIFKPNPSVNNRWDVAFIGNKDGFERHRRLELIRKALPPKRLIVRQGKDHAETAWILMQSKIGWNQIFYPDTKWGSCYRVWEVTGTGIALCTNATNDIRQVFTDGKNAIFWRNDKEMVEKILYYLNEAPDKLAAIASAGCKLAHSKHTWRHRIVTFRDILRKYYR